MKVEQLTCKACATPFQRKRCAPGKSPSYCSYKCEYETRLKRKADRTRERYHAMRDAGVEPWRARLNSTGQANTDRVLAEMRAQKEVASGAAE
jgi:hypothetical protein